MNRSRGVGVLTIALACTVVGACATQEPEDETTTIGVAAAPSLTAAFTEMIDIFEDEHPGVTVSLELGRSDTIAAGLPGRDDINIFASASEEAMQQVVDAGVAVDPRVFARNHVVVAVPSGNPRRITGLRDLERPDLRVGLCAMDVPCGKAAETLLSAAGVEPPGVERDSGSRALAARLADNDVGIVYRTDVAASHGWVAQVEVDQRDRELAQTAGTTRYSVARVVRGEEGADSEGERAATDDFLELVVSDRGRRALENTGLAPLPQ
ncbi:MULTISPECIES: molybdate ABC transporter substrate-binding protein [Dietzia]|uniref:Molybdate ABC transporter substrate-binding protein n=1 Tax=Dietzia cinnamea TaxID=321318 RepID=A0A4R3ZU63_9ACTN|nr:MULTISPECIES: substrate-binding domain-containing protein [Dietzia]MCT1863481.1 substrate-binding domain-containing protein [Dietzia cinnamea]MCT2029153.1 substrate-binding domain-containing protein [Dietzia cinnamea]MCT2032794.1 substrate-binding domain-containing protein [Dietzia cinnamea]MCT2058099.1 substrate-binding domain-containing protein [Dietzia cinnamea]MCT2075334.1 substrate-binding domain-containing protein [Dietzia cinnamea]